MSLQSLKTFFLAIFVVLLALLLIKVFDISYPLTVTTTNKTTELAIVGEGKVEVVPDTAFVDVGITVDNEPTTEAVKKKIDEINNKIILAMKSLGIKKEFIKTTNYSIYPNYRYEGNINQITGYNGNVTLNIKVSNPQFVSQVIEAATKAGANQIQGVRFVVDKPEKYREEAREKAIKNAKEQAQKLAKNLGIKLGKVVNIVESTPELPGPLYRTSVERLGAGGGGPMIEPGTQMITSVVTLYFEKK